MLRDIGAIIKSALKGNKLDREDEEFLKGLSVGDKFDEPTAYAILLTELSRMDGHFDEKEERIIEQSLAKLFPLAAHQIPEIMQTAQAAFESFRGTSSCLEIIKEEYSIQERETLYNLINQVIAADNLEEPIEIYLKNKFRMILSGN